MENKIKLHGEYDIIQVNLRVARCGGRVGQPNRKCEIFSTLGRNEREGRAKCFAYYLSDHNSPSIICALNPNKYLWVRQQKVVVLSDSIDS